MVRLPLVQVAVPGMAGAVPPVFGAYRKETVYCLSFLPSEANFFSVSAILVSSSSESVDRSVTEPSSMYSSRKAVFWAAGMLG